MLSALAIVGVAEASPAIAPGSTYYYRRTYRISTTVEGRTIDGESRSEYIIVVEDVNGDHIEYIAYTPYLGKVKGYINRADIIVSIGGVARDYDGNGYAEYWAFWRYPCYLFSLGSIEVFVNPNWEEHADSLRANADELRALPCFILRAQAGLYFDAVELVVEAYACSSDYLLYESPYSALKLLHGAVVSIA